MGQHQSASDSMEEISAAPGTQVIALILDEAWPATIVDEAMMSDTQREYRPPHCCAVLTFEEFGLHWVEHGNLFRFDTLVAQQAIEAIEDGKNDARGRAWEAALSSWRKDKHELEYNDAKFAERLLREGSNDSDGPALGGFEPAQDVPLRRKRRTQHSNTAEAGPSRPRWRAPSPESAVVSISSESDSDGSDSDDDVSQDGKEDVDGHIDDEDAAAEWSSVDGEVDQNRNGIVGDTGIVDKPRKYDPKVVNVYVGTPPTVLKLRRATVQKDLHLSRMYSWGNEKGYFIGKPSLDAIKPEHFSAILEYLDTKDFDPKINTDEAGVSHFIDDITDDNQQDMIVKLIYTFDAARALPLPPVFELVAQKLELLRPWPTIPALAAARYIFDKPETGDDESVVRDLFVNFMAENFWELKGEDSEILHDTLRGCGSLSTPVLSIVNRRVARPIENRKRSISITTVEGEPVEQEADKRARSDSGVEVSQENDRSNTVGRPDGERG